MNRARTPGAARPSCGRPAARAILAGLLTAAFLAGVVRPAAAQDEEAPPPAAPADTAPTGPEVEAVRFPGAEALETFRLQEAIETQPTRCRSTLLTPVCLIADWDWAVERAYLDREALADDEERLETLYEIWGYPDARVASRVIAADDEPVVVEFRIDEGEPILVESVAVRGLEGIVPPVELPDTLPLEVGEPYALPRLEATQQLIADSLGERGRPWAEVEVGGAVDEAARTASIVLEVDPGPTAVFGPALIQAEPPIEEEVVRERLLYEPGEPYRLSVVEETERALFDLPIVESAVVEPIAREPGETVVRTRVAVASRDVQGLSAEGALSSTDCIEFAGYWNHRYLLGGPRTLSLGAGLSNLLAEQTDGGFPCTSAGEDEFAVINYFAEAELRQPWPGDPRTTALAAGFVNRESAPNSFIQTGYGARLGVARDYGRRWTLTALYEPARNELDAADIFFCGNYGVCSREGIEELSEPTWLSPVELLLVQTPLEDVRRRDPDIRPPPWELGPTRPWSSWLRAGAELAAPFTASEFDYARGVLEASATRYLGARYELAGRSRLGLLADAEVVPPQVRLYSGGVNTVRGVEQNLLGPRILVTSPETARRLGCELRVGGCPPGLRVGDDPVTVRPLGGDALLEANIEGRIWIAYTVQLAAFVDFGLLGRNLFADDHVPFVTDDWEALLTPGVGIRVLTGLGPVRIDLGYDPRGPEELALITESADGRRLLPLGRVGFAPFDVDAGFPTELWHRLQLHVAVGQPF